MEDRIEESYDLQVKGTSLAHPYQEPGPQLVWEGEGQRQFEATPRSVASLPEMAPLPHYKVTNITRITSGNHFISNFIQCIFLKVVIVH